MTMVSDGDAALSDVLMWARSLEIGSNHPIAKAIVTYVDQELPTQVRAASSLERIRETAGFGLEAVLVDQKIESKEESIKIGKLSSFADYLGFEVAEKMSVQEGDFSKTKVCLAKNNRILAVFTLSDRLRLDASDGLKALRSLGIKPLIATGDGKDAALAVAKALGGVDVLWEKSPGDKAALIRELKKAGRLVAMAGDGINDAPALAEADVGLAMGSGTDAAIATAGVILKDPSIGKIVEAIRISRATFRNIKENLFWAFAYNALLIPAAALGKLSPMLAGAAMAASSLFVVGNALWLKIRI